MVYHFPKGSLARLSRTSSFENNVIFTFSFTQINAMTAVILYAVTVYMLHLADTYILITATMDDVQELAQQFVESPVMEELNRIWRRASNRVKEKLGEPQEHQFSRRSNIQDDAIVSLAKNASIYIKTFKKALGNLK